MKKKILLITLVFIGALFLTGCKQDNMEDINIIVTNYPNEYITKKLYGAHATIKSVYPDGVDISNYNISKKQKLDFSKNDLFIYNGKIEKENNLAFDLLDLNQNLKIIDTAYVLETDYAPEELWLNPSSLLMMAQNIRLGLEEYSTSTYLKKDIDASYEKLKISLSELDADYRVAVENTNNKTVLVANSTFKYLEKFGLKVICVDSDASDKTINDAQNLIKKGDVSYIYSFKGEKLSENAQKLLDNNSSSLKKLELNKLDNISDSDRNNKKTYISIMNENLELLKQELYQ
mgnify:FL=1